MYSLLIRLAITIVLSLLWANLVYKDVRQGRWGWLLFDGVVTVTALYFGVQVLR